MNKLLSCQDLEKDSKDNRKRYNKSVKGSTEGLASYKIWFQSFKHIINAVQFILIC